MQKNLTDLTIQRLSPGTYFDAKTPAFGIRIGKNRRTWIVVKGPRERRVQTILGHYPALSLSDARRSAMAALAAPHEPKSALAFPEAVEAFLGQDRWKPRSKVVLASSLKHFTWTRPLDKITHEDVAQTLDAIAGKSARSHALKDIRTFFNWCVPRYLTSSPAAGLKMPAYRPRERVLTDSELRQVWHAASEMGLYGKQIQCLITTGQRMSQIVRYDPAWLTGDLITFPASVMKGNREHTIPVGPMTLALLPHLKPVAMQGKKKFYLDTRSGVSDWVVHDLRRVLASQWAALGIGLQTIEVYLSHRSGSFAGIVGVYQKHTWLPEMRSAVILWENRLLSLVR